MSALDARALVAWFRREARALPWRTARRDPYATWVSEVMLQQTRVETVLRSYEPFLRRFPDVRALAAASEDDVMKAWEGLGYYRRARFLHAGARAVVERGGALPASAAELRELPGFGPYTAGAVASLAFGERAPCVDGNVERVFARQTATAKPARADVEAWVACRFRDAAPGELNEALMELGAMVCTPRAPRCEACPVAATCAGRAEAQRLPARSAKGKRRVARVAMALVERDGKLLLEKREEGLLAGTWGLPTVEGSAAALAARVESIVGAPARVGRVAGRARHQFTHLSWEMRAYRVETAGAGGEWRRAEDVALSTAHRKLLATCRARAPSSPSPRRRP